MKKLTILFSLLFCGIVAAQNFRQRAEVLSANFEKHFNISNEQKTKLTSFISDKLNAVAEAGKGKDQEKANVAVMLEKRKYFSEIKTILTEEQFNAWQVLRSEQTAAINKGEKVSNPVVDADLDMLIKK